MKPFSGPFVKKAAASAPLIGGIGFLGECAWFFDGGA
jgi:hypothetical protein